MLRQPLLLQAHESLLTALRPFIPPSAEIPSNYVHESGLSGQWWSFTICTLAARALCQSLFKTSPVTRRPTLKRLSGIQVQLLSLCMGKHQILPNCSLSLRLNFIFEITNEIGQQLCHKCCFFCSNSIIKRLFFRLDQPVRMRSPRCTSQNVDCFYSNRDF